MRKHITRIAAALAALSMLQSLPAFALRDAMQSGFVRTETAALEDTTVYVGQDYIITDTENNALTVTRAGFDALTGKTEEGFLYYPQAEVWQFFIAADGKTCTLRPSERSNEYLAYDGNALYLTEDAAAALTFGFQLPGGNASEVLLYSEAQKSYLSWTGGKLTLSKEKAAVRLYRVSETENAYFYVMKDGKAELTDTVSVWAGDTFTMPQLPESGTGKPDCWVQFDPENGNAQLGKYQPGEESCAISGGTYFLANYQNSEATVTLVGIGYSDSVTTERGKGIAFHTNAGAPDTYLLYDSKGNAELIRKDVENVVEITATDSQMYLCACEVFNEEQFVRITTADDLKLMRNLINSANADTTYRMVMTNDISLAASNVSDALWEPISAPKSSVDFRGANHKLNGMLCVKENKDPLGLFGSVKDLTVLDLMIGGVVRGGGSAGLLCGACESAKIIHCGAEHAQVVQSGTAGGLIGAVGTDLTMRACFFTGEVAGLEGGMLFGKAKNAAVSDCFIYGSLNPENEAFGLASDTFEAENLYNSAKDGEDAFRDGTVLNGLNAKLKLWAQSENYPVFALGSYNLIVEHDKQGGSLSIPTTVYEAGETVTFTAKAAEGLTLSLSAVLAGTETEIPITEGIGEDTYCFDMPAGDTALSIHFVKQEASKRKRGDVDCNGDVNVLDAVLLARVVAEDGSLKDGEVTDDGKANAECDGAEGITSGDLRTLLNALAGKAELE